MKIDRKSNPVARRVQKRGQMKKSHFASPCGTGQLMQLESRLEASAAIAMGLDPRVRMIRSQPVTFDLVTGRTFPNVDALEGEKKQYGLRCVAYTPDFEIELAASRVFVEVKHRRLIKQNPSVLDYPGILARYGHRMVIIDDQVLDEVFVRNLRLLKLSRNTRIGDAEAARIVETCAPGVPYGHLLECGAEAASILALLARGHLTCDLRAARLNHQTIVRASNGEPAHLKELPLVRA